MGSSNRFPGEKNNAHRRQATLAALLMLSQASRVWADTTDAFQFFQEEAKVITASRREQSVLESPSL